jgi:secondary thiamine-phosphate synthase enzyme
MHQMEIRSHRQSELIDITQRVKSAVAESGMRYGLCHLFVPHTTAGILLNENWDTTVKDDILGALRTMVPEGPYNHREGNSPAHIMAALVGTQVTVLVEDGLPILGTWQGIFLAEFDGPRNRRVLIQVVGLPDDSG